MQNLQNRYLSAKRALFEKAYGELNKEQREAVFTVDGPLLVLAGAGSGKTTVLVRRIAFIIKYGNAYYSDYVPFDISEEKVASLERAAGLPKEMIFDILPEFIQNPCAPWRMLAITFTNKAAGEIKHRIVTQLGDDSISSEIWSGTFHSVCLRILRAHGDKLGYASGFSIYDTDDTKKAITACMKDLNIDTKALPVKSVQNLISRAKDKMISPEAFLTEVGNDYRLKQVARIYDAYQKRLVASNALDFDDIIMQTVILLRNYQDVREYYRNKFRYVCVDEYQDTNEAQFALTALLSGGFENIMVVGDDDQSIYKFRGATIENILNFDKTFPNAKTIRLEQNYRSTQNILDAANAVIAHNVGRKGKNLWTNAGEGEKIHLKKVFDHNEEARYIADKISAMVQKGASFKDFALLYRNNAQSSTIERTFAKSGIPYRIIGGVRFSDRKEIKDIVAYLQLIQNHNDDERLVRIINEPKRKIGDKTIEGVRAIAREQGIPMFRVIENADKYVALAKSAKTLTEFASLINYFTSLIREVSLETLINTVMDRSGYRQTLIDAGESERDRLENLEEFLTGAIEYQNSFTDDGSYSSVLEGFMEETALVADVDRYDESADAVVLMTAHSAKGLEFPYVFLPGMEEGLFPSMQSVMASDAEVEEERRLAYVAITRAKKELFVVHANQRMLYGRTQFNPASRFLKEIPEELIAAERSPYDSPKKPVHSYSEAYYRPATDNISIGSMAKRPVISNDDVLSVGDRVLHANFGEGDIISVKKMGADWLYEVIFDKVGTKKLMKTYAKLKKI
ncbi:MAG: ATP-dependent helicase [Eubacteriales bacterium]